MPEKRTIESEQIKKENLQASEYQLLEATLRGGGGALAYVLALQITWLATVRDRMLG